VCIDSLSKEWRCRAAADPKERLCPVWVKRVGFVMSAICLVCPKQQTLPDPVGASHQGHEATFRLVVKAASGGRRSTLPSAVARHCTRDCKVFLETLDLTSLRRRKLVSTKTNDE
jgi:hypothetical protein